MISDKSADNQSEVKISGANITKTVICHWWQVLWNGFQEIHFKKLVLMSILCLTKEILPYTDPSPSLTPSPPYPSPLTYPSLSLTPSLTPHPPLLLPSLSLTPPTPSPLPLHFTPLPYPPPPTFIKFFQPSTLAVISWPPPQTNFSKRYT